MWEPRPRGECRREPASKAKELRPEGGAPRQSTGAFERGPGQSQPSVLPAGR